MVDAARRATLGLALLALVVACGSDPVPEADAPHEVSDPHAGHAGHAASVDAAALVTGEFDLRNARTGEPVTTTSYDGHWRLVFFGFTHCTAVCPVGLSTLGGVLDALGERAAELRTLFVTVDPARDDAARVAAFLELFDPRITGLVGSEAQIASAMAAFRIEAHRIATGGDSYQLDHPAIFFLMDRQGRYVRSFPSGGDATVMAGEISAVLDDEAAGR